MGRSSERGRGLGLGMRSLALSETVYSLELQGPGASSEDIIALGRDDSGERRESAEHSEDPAGYAGAQFGYSSRR